ncbi:MAG TPA: alanine--tRNA ligase [Gaiellaceae bacterium]|nr:alanine--tRNA ligase [Gaiellaceae bacterium]
MRTTAELREGFLAFFEEKGHLRRPSASLIPRADDRSTLLTSAGMQPQMPYFLGLEPPPAPLTTTCQKVFRTVDIDNVGLDTYHLTFFEMLGNFSFGRYFKEGAIEYAREFIQERLQIDWDRVWVSVHAGDPELKLGPDEEAIGFWQAVGMPPERIVPLPSSENFWSVGGPGPCGPDSEMYWDWGEETGCGADDCKPGCTRCERFLEFGNLVFMSYELHGDGTLTELPSKNIDTGWGLERVARVVQDVASVYDTDGYQLIMDWVAGQSGVAYGESQDATKAHRVLADHGRGMTFLAAEGVTPSNEGRGYVLRRVVRRAVQHGLRIGMQSPFLPGLTDVVIEQMGQAYPELVEHRAEIHRVLAAEEERFGATLERGMAKFEEAAAKGEITAEDVFDLQTTYGFPPELTEELARERGLAFNDEEYTSLIEKHREISRQGTGRYEPRLVEAPRTDFVGYEQFDVRTAITAYADLGDGYFQVKLAESPFYPAGGGQVTDTGWIEKDDGTRADLVEALRLENDQELVFRGAGFAEGDRVRAVVAWNVRYPTMANHTATHLLHKVLQEVLGEHVKQAGSAVRPDKLRFDFTHPEALSPEERAEVETRVNGRVFANLPVRIFETPIDEARNLGATMLFGEKYGDVVRVVDIDGWSVELCGGTHVRSTAEIGPFSILSESSVGAGSRRIEAVTAGEAFALLHERAREADVLRGELDRARKESKRPGAAQQEVDFTIVDREGDVVLAEAKAVKGGPLRDLSDRLRQQEKADGAIVASVDDGRAFLVVNFDESLVARGLDAVQVVKELGKHIGGGGGGKPTLAEAGGKNPGGVADALAAAKVLVAP